MEYHQIPILKTVTTPSNPSSGFLKLYFKSDGLLYKLDSSGVEQVIGSGSMQKKTYTWAAGGGDSSVTFADADILANSIITGRTITAGTQVGFWERDLSSGNITINSTASETGNITFTYSYVI